MFDGAGTQWVNEWTNPESQDRLKPQYEALRRAGATQVLLMQAGVIGISSNIVWAQAPVKLLLSSPRHVLDDPYYEEVVHKKGDDAAYERAKIEYLIERIRSSHKTFLRNRESHTASEAANHIAMKWYRSGVQVQTARNCIRYIASNSSMTGEPYLVKFHNGDTYPTGKIFYNELERLEMLVGREGGSNCSSAQFKFLH